jgi:hypothetical protein
MHANQNALLPSDMSKLLRCNVYWGLSEKFGEWLGAGKSGLREAKKAHLGGCVKNGNSISACPLGFIQRLVSIIYQALQIV